MAKKEVAYYVTVDSSGVVKGWNKAGEATEKLRRSLLELQIELEYVKGLREKSTDLTKINEYNSRIKDLTGQIKTLKGETEETSTTFFSFDRIMKIAAAGGVGMVFQRAVSRSIEKGKEFEQQLADLQAIVGVSDAELSKLSRAALEYSKVTGVAAREQVEAYKLLAGAIDMNLIGGVKGLETLGREVVTLSQAAGVDLALAANTVAAAMNQWKLPGEESSRVVNVLAAGSREGAAEVNDLADSLSFSGTTAALAGQSIETTVAALEILGENAVKGMRAGTGLRNVLTILQTESDKLAKLGIHDINLQSDGLALTLQKLAPLLKDNAAMAELFGRETLNSASILIANAAAVGEMEKRITGTNAAQEQAAIQTNTYEGAVNKLSTTIDSVLIPAFTKSSGLAVRLINNVAGLIDEFAGGLSVINGWLDVHSELRRELELVNDATDAQINTMQKQRKQLTDSLLAGNLTAEQQKELSDAYDASNAHLIKQAEALELSTNEARKARIEAQAQLDHWREVLNIDPTLPLDKLRSRGIGVINDVLDALAAADLQVQNNTEQLRLYYQAISEGAMSFDEFTASIEAANAAQFEGPAATDEQINDLRTLAGLQAEIALEKAAFEKANNNLARDSHNERMKELQSVVDAIVQRYKVEETNLDSIAGVKAAISAQEEAFLKASSQEEREKHAQAMTELQEILNGMQIKAAAEQNNLNTLAGLQAAISAQEQAFLNAATDADRIRAAEELERLRLIHEAKLNYMTVEELLKQQQDESDAERHTVQMQRISERLQAASQVIGAIANLSATLHNNELNRLQAQKKEMNDRYAQQLANENLTDAQREQLLNKQAEQEAAFDRQIAAQKKKAAQAQKKWAVAQIAMSTAIAIMEAAPDPFRIAATIVLGLTQTAAVIAAEIPEFETGGKIGGRRHKDGGTLIEAEEGEFIVNRKSTEKALPLIQKINSDPNTAAKLNKLLRSRLPIFPYASHLLFAKLLSIMKEKTPGADQQFRRGSDSVDYPMMELGGVIGYANPSYLSIPAPALPTIELPSNTFDSNLISQAIREGFENLQVRTVREGRYLVDYVERELSRRNKDIFNG